MREKVLQYITISKDKLAVVFTILVLYLSVPAEGRAQAAGPLASDTIAHPADRQMDVVDLLKLILHIRQKAAHKPTARDTIGPFFSVIAFPGYALATGVAGVATANISFRTSRSLDGELSFLNNQFQYTQYNQIIVQSISNFYTRNEKWQFPGDIRFFHFPTNTYGLGSNTLPANEDKINFHHFRFYRTVLRKVYPGTFVGIGYNLDYRWDIHDYNADRGMVTDMVRYGYKKNSVSSGLSANFLYDTRDNPNRPTSGSYFNFQIISYLKPLGSNNYWNAMFIDLRQYVSLTHKWYTVLGFWGYAWIGLSGKPPYLDLPSIGWDTNNNSGRGYAAGRYRGRNMFYLEAELRFDIMRNGLLGAVIFGNMQTLSDYPGRYFGDIQPGGGAGLRIKFNKHTKSNASLDYGFGTHGSRGFATNINEVF